ncbi:MAG: RbsD/FucU family protein [Eubacteriales bacterium]|nr:fucose isomerase [Clostridiales bacterium]
MLCGIPPILSPELLKVLCEMGHGDEIVIADGNFPGASCAKNSILLRADGHGVPELLDAILTLFPLDEYAPPVALMAKAPQDEALEIPIWNEFRAIVDKYTTVPFEFMERHAFYERAKKAYAILMTGERAIYANIIIKKGVVKF